MVGMVDGMIPGTTIASGRGMTRSSGTIPTGATLPGMDRIMATMAITPTVIMATMAIILAIIVIITIILIIMHTGVAADIIIPTMAILVPSTEMAARMAISQVTAQ